MEEETTMGHYRQVLTARREPTRELRHAISQAWTGLMALHDGAMADDAVPVKPEKARGKGANLGELVLEAAGAEGR
jgi:hypothetical protein